MLQHLQKNFFEQIQKNTKDISVYTEGASLTPEKGLEIYQFAYWKRLEEFLEKDFPGVKKNIGSRRFSQLSKEYFSAYPSRFFNATDVTRFFPDFLEDKKCSSKFSFIAELARYEWLLRESFYALEPERVGLQKIPNASERDWHAARFLLDPSVRLLESKWRLDLLKQGKQSNVKNKSSYTFLFYRSQGLARVMLITAAEANFFRALYRRESLEKASAFLSSEVNADSFSFWLHSGILHSIIWI